MNKKEASKWFQTLTRLERLLLKQEKTRRRRLHQMRNTKQILFSTEENINKKYTDYLKVMPVLFRRFEFIDSVDVIRKIVQLTSNEFSFENLAEYGFDKVEKNNFVKGFKLYTFLDKQLIYTSVFNTL